MLEDIPKCDILRVFIREFVLKITIYTTNKVYNNLVKLKQVGNKLTYPLYWYTARLLSLASWWVISSQKFKILMTFTPYCFCFTLKDPRILVKHMGAVGQSSREETSNGVRKS